MGITRGLEVVELFAGNILFAVVAIVFLDGWRVPAFSIIGSCLHTYVWSTLMDQKYGT